LDHFQHKKAGEVQCLKFQQTVPTFQVVDSKFGTSNNIYAIAYGGNKFVAGGNYGKIAYSSNGITWTKVDVSGIFGSTGVIYAVAYDGNGTFVIGGTPAVK